MGETLETAQIGALFTRLTREQRIDLGLLLRVPVALDSFFFFFPLSPFFLSTQKGIDDARADWTLVGSCHLD